MSESDREKLLKLRQGGCEAPQITGVITIQSDHTPPKRPMTEAEEKLITAALEFNQYGDSTKDFYEARRAVHRERCNQTDIDAVIAAHETFGRAVAALRAAKKAVPSEIIQEEFSKRGWRC